MKFRKLFAFGSLAAALAVSGVVTAQTLNVVTAGDQNMVDYVNNYLGAEVRGDESGREGARGRHRPGRRRLAEDLREAVGAAEGGISRVGHRRRRRAPARRGDDGQREAADAVSQRHRRRQARLARHREERARRQRRRLRAADVPQPDRVRVQPGSRQESAEVVRGAGRMGEEEPEAVRLQRRQGRHVRRRLRHGLGQRQQPPRRQAGKGALRSGAKGRRSTSRSRASRTSTSTW